MNGGGSLTTQTAIVIGAGVGGLATAARLARHGYAVTVIEQLDRPGGRCGRLTLDGYRMDTGPTLYLMPEVYRQTFSDLGEEVEEHLDLRRVDPTYHLHFGDGSYLSLTSDWEQLKAQLEAFEAGSFEQFQRYFEEGRRHYHQAMRHLVKRNFRSLREFASLKNAALLFQLKVLNRHHANLRQYFSDARLRAAFSFQDLYMGLNPFKAPALYSMLPYAELDHGIWFPMGGMYSVVEALENIAKRLGVAFCYGTPVERITTKGQFATGVSLADGDHLPAAVVVANADLTYVYRSLLPVDSKARKLEGKHYGCSVLIFCWGLDREYPQLEAHNLFLAEDYRGSLDPIFKDFGLAADPSFYVHAPARMDPSMAPAGHESLTVAVPVGHINEAVPQDWDSLPKRARNSVLRRFAAEGLSDLESHIQFEWQFAPPDLRDQLNLYRGSAHGLSHNLTQMGYFRPHNRHPSYRNLYFVGASTHPGTGVPTVLISAQLVVERILEEIGIPSPHSVVSPSIPSRKIAIDV